MYEGNQLLVPAGSVLRGVVSSVKKAGRLERKGVLTLSFDQITVDGRDYPIRATVTQAIESSGVRGEAGKIGTAAGVGAIIGGILGGFKGALAGILIGGGGTIAATEGNDVKLDTGTILRIRFDSPVPLERTIVEPLTARAKCKRPDRFDRAVSIFRACCARSAYTRRSFVTRPTSTHSTTKMLPSWSKHAPCGQTNLPTGNCSRAPVRIAFHESAPASPRCAITLFSRSSSVTRAHRSGTTTTPLCSLKWQGCVVPVDERDVLAVQRERLQPAIRAIGDQQHRVRRAAAQVDHQAVRT